MSTEPIEDPSALIVEDDRALLTAYKRALSNAGYRVETAIDGSEAIRAVEQRAFDVILSDLELPEIDGMELLSRVRAHDMDVPVVLITGNPSLETAIMAMERGAMRYLVKPVELHALVNVMADAIRVHRTAIARRHELELARSALTLKDRAEKRAAGAEAAQETIVGTLNAIMECMPALIIAVDLQGKVQFINKAMDNYTMEEIIGSDFLRYLPRGDEGAQRARLQRIVETGAHETYETALRSAEGQETALASHMVPMRVQGKVVGAVLVSHDITDLKRAQADAVGAQRLAAVGTLAAGIAHEINTPIQFINDSFHFLREASQDVMALMEKLSSVCHLAAEGVHSDAIRDAAALVIEAEEATDLGYLRDSVPKAFERCLDGLERVATIVRSMKEFAHPSEHQMTWVDLNRAIQSTLTIARSEYKYVADLEVEFGELPPVRCHVNDINQAVLNLVVNAAHAVGEAVRGSDRKGVIGVSTRQEGEYVVIAIRDSGAGIPDAIAHRIFEPFFTTKGVGKGTGQGLALVWTVVKNKHDGELKFTSKVGEGTTFFIRLRINGQDDEPVAKPVS